MKKHKYITTALIAAAVLFNSSCKKYLDINTDPNNIVGTPANAPIPQILSSATVNIGFMGGSFQSIIQNITVQQLSGQSTGTLNQTQDYEKYNNSPTDQNTSWNSYYDTSINDLDIIIAKAKATGSPHYAGVAEVLRAYTYQCMVDIWGKIPYSTADQTVANLTPTLDDDAAIYTDLVKQIDLGIADLNATNPSSASIDPNLSSTIFQASTWAASKAKWVTFANTLKLRIFLHYSKKDAVFTATQINALVNSGAAFMGSNADSFQMPFVAAAGARNPIYNFEQSRANYLVGNALLINMMKAKADPRIPFYFLPVPKSSPAAYVGAVGGAASNAALYSHIGTYLTGAAGEAPIRMLTFAEYNFIRAEAALKYATPGGTAQAFFTAGITASMTDAGVSAANIATYLAANGTLSANATTALQQIILEKYTANFDVVCEPWTDWRRTGYPAIVPPANALLAFVPRSFYYPQSETDTNPNIPQKSGMDVRVFWDVP